MAAQKVLEDTRAELRALPTRPSPEDVERAQRALANIDRQLLAKLEAFVSTPAPAGVDAEAYKGTQRTKQQMLTTEAESEKQWHLAVVDLANQHDHLHRVIRKAELACLGDSSVEENTKVTKEASARKLLQDIEQSVAQGEREIDWAGRDIEVLPEAVGRTSAVILLDLSNNFLETLPDSIAGLSSLEELNVRGNKLIRLPDSIGSLHNLRKLNLSKNLLTELPESICWCRQLEELDVVFNKLEKVPERLGEACPNLRKLALGLNKLKFLPKSVGQLQSLTHLDAHFNQLQEVPSSVGRLSNLQTLNLSDNFADLTEVPSSMGDLASLTYLNLSNNQIRELPVEFGKLKQLGRLALEGNPWREPPLELVEQQNTEVLTQYLGLRYKNYVLEHPQNSSMLAGWAEWISKLLGGNFQGLGAWLNDVMAGNPPQLTGAQQRGRAMELGGIEAPPAKQELDSHYSAASSQLSGSAPSKSEAAEVAVAVDV